MHYPPETCTIMLLARIFATVEQAKDKEAVFQAFSNFCSRSSEDCATLEDKLGSWLWSKILVNEKISPSALKENLVCKTSEVHFVIYYFIKI